VSDSDKRQIFEYAYVHSDYSTDIITMERGEVLAVDIKDAHVAVGAKVGFAPTGLVVRPFDPNYGFGNTLSNSRG
jgi:hypothetical protein